MNRYSNDINCHIRLRAVSSEIHQMRAVISLLCFSAFCHLHAQSGVTFRLNSLPLEQGESIVVRGSFNQWSGADYQLTHLPGEDLYTGNFLLKEAPGDTIQYKFVLLRSDGSAYWERNPNPADKDYGNRTAVIGPGGTELPVATFDLDEYFRYPVVFSQEKLQEDFIQARSLLEEIHPALYDYTEKEVLDSIFDHGYRKINGTMDFRGFYTLLAEILAPIGCGHTSLWIPSDFWNPAPDRFFPLKLTILGSGAVVAGEYGNTDTIPPGSEIKSVNGKSIQEIFRELESAVSADGFNRSNIIRRIERDFSKKYALHFGFPDQFRITYRAPGQDFCTEALLDPASIELIDQDTWKGSELSFREVDGASTGILTINTFGYYDRVDMFQAFMDSVFRVVREREIGNLILDLRRNGGGDPFCSSYLFSFLEQKPVPYFAEPYRKYARLADPIPRAEDHFTGNLITLIDGHGFSTTGHFCALLKYHGIGQFVGEELGATFTCTGNAQYIDLENTRIILGTARVSRYSAAVQDMDPMRGVMPDFPVEPTRQDIINGTDRVLEFALSLASDKSD